MRYQRSDAELMKQAADAIAGQTKQIEDLKIKLYQVKQRVCTFIFGDLERPIDLTFHREAYPSFEDQLRDRAKELEAKGENR